MRNYTYQSSIVTELYCKDNLSRCVVSTLYYDDTIVSHLMWMTKRQFEAALDGDQDTRRAIEMAYTDLVKSGRI